MLTPEKQKKSTSWRADQRPICAPNNSELPEHPADDLGIRCVDRAPATLGIARAVDRFHNVVAVETSRGFSEWNQSVA